MVSSAASDVFKRQVGHVGPPWRPACFPHAGGNLMRYGTTIVTALLLAAILSAAVVQFVLLVD